MVKPVTTIGLLVPEAVIAVAPVTQDAVYPVITMPPLELGA